MNQLLIDEEFKSLIPPLSNEEYKQLEENIKSEGCRDSLVVWEGVLIDGHNRYRICTNNNIQFETVDKHFNSRDEAKEWVIKNQFGRRNLSTFQKTELAFMLEDLYKEKARERQLEGKKVDVTLSSIGDKVEKGRVDEKLAKIAGVGSGTIHRARKVREEAPIELLEKVKSGEKTLNSAYNEIKAKQPVTPKNIERSDEYKTESPKPKSIVEKLREKVKALEEEIAELKKENKEYEILAHELNNRLQTAENKDYFENQNRMEKMLNE